MSLTLLFLPHGSSSNISTFEDYKDFLADENNTVSTTYIEANNGSTYYRGLFDPAQFDNITGLFFEAVIKVSGGGTGSAKLFNNTDSVDFSTAVSTATAGYARVRSSAITIPGAAKELCVYFKTTAGTVGIAAARLVIQQGSGATKKETEVLMTSSDVYTGSTPVVDPFEDIWLYEATKFDGVTGIYFDALMSNNTIGQTTTLTLRDLTASSDVVSITHTSNGNTRHRSADVKASLIDGHEYGVFMSATSTSQGQFGIIRLIIAQANFTKTQLILTPDTGAQNAALTAIGVSQFDPSKYGAYAFSMFAELVANNLNAGSTLTINITDTSNVNETNGNVSTIAGDTLVHRYRNLSGMTVPGAAKEYQYKTSGTFGNINVARILINISMSAGANTKGFTAGLGFSGSLNRTTNKGITGALSFTGSLTKLIGKTLVAAVLGFAGVLAKQTNKGINASVGFTGTLGRAIVKGISASLSFTGNLGRAIVHGLSATLSFAGNLVKRTAHSFTASLGFTGNLISGVAHFFAMTASLGFSGNLARRDNKSINASLGFTGVLGRSIGKLLTATLSFTGSLSRLIRKSIGATLSFTGNMIAGIAHVLALTAALGFTGVLTTSHVFIKALTASVGFAGNLTKQTAKSLGASIGFNGSLARRVNKNINGSLGFVGSLTLVKSLHTIINASLGFTGNLTKRSARSFTASLGFTGNLVKVLVGAIITATKPTTLRNVATKLFLRTSKGKGDTPLSDESTTVILKEKDDI